VRRRPPVTVVLLLAPQGRLAQLVERLLYTQVAAGSSPAPPIKRKAPLMGAFHQMGRALPGEQGDA
jgi:hypothetical protein